MKLQVIHSLTDRQIDDLSLLYRSAWWASDRTMADICLMLEQTDIIVGLWDLDTESLLGFGRILTDYVYVAMLFDVIVAEAYRGEGLGQRLMTEIINHPPLQQVAKIYLNCLPEMVPYYESFGFTTNTGGVELMQRLLKTGVH